MTHASEIPSAPPIVMGIVNITPDSFSGDGILPREDYVAHALVQAEQMIADGARILDIGGESSRPGSVAVTADEEISRVVPAIEAIRGRQIHIPIAVDTMKAEVADAALRAGATMINDISALGDTHMAEVAARHGAEIVLMHNRAASGAITYDAIAGGQYDASEDYEDVVEDVARDLAERIKVALSAKIARDKIIIDPGIGFGKTPHQNVELIAHMYHFKQLGFRVLMGPSRKSFIGKLLDLPVGERVEGTAACVTACVLQGADIVRVHDVKFMTRVVRMATLLRDA